MDSKSDTSKTASTNEVSKTTEIVHESTQPVASEDESIFHQLELEYQATVQVLDSDAKLGKFKDEYSRLFTTLVKSHENERKLLKKCQELQTEVIAQASQVQNAMKMNQSDRGVISGLKKDIKRAWELIDELKEKEEKARESVTLLRAEIGVLESTIQQTEDAGAGQEQTINDLLRQKEELIRERDNQVNQIIQLRSDITEFSDKIRHLELEKAQFEHQISNLKETIATKKAEAEKEAKNREKLERDVKEARYQVEQKTSEIHQKQEYISRAKDESTRLENQIKDQRLLIEKTVKEQEQLQLKIAKVQQDYEEQIQTTSRLLADNQKKASELREHEEEISYMKTEIKTLNKAKENLMKKLKQVEELKSAVESERDHLRNINSSLEKDLENLRRDLDIEKKHVEETSRERDLINKNLLKSLSATQKQITLVKLQEQSKRNLEQDIQVYKEEAAKQRKIIFQLEKEREKYISDTTQAQSECSKALDTLKIKENEIFDYKKKIYDVENKLKQQQNLYEAVRGDRNLYSKNLIEAQDELNELKRKFSVVSHQVEQLKEEIRSKDNLINRENQESQKLEKERDALRVNINKLKQQSELAEQYFHNQQIEQHKLRTIAQEAEAEKNRQRKDYEALLQERDAIGAQLVRRNDELALLYEKMKIQQSILTKGEAQYNERLDEIKVLKMEISQLRQENVTQSKEVEDIDKLKGEIVHLEKKVLREKNKVKTLEDQLQNPVNIHRWRQLEGTDPEMFAMIKKVQFLQKRLIQKSEEVVEKEIIIKQKEKVYEELKSIIEKQPGVEVIEKVNLYQQLLKNKTTQLKAMTSELNMYRNQVQGYKDEMSRLSEEISQVKKGAFRFKKGSVNNTQQIVEITE